MSDQVLDELSLLVADGESLDLSEPFNASDDSDSVRNLAGLAALRDLFRSRSAGVAAAEPQCPFTWGRLEALEVVGVGGFSRVYRAHDPDLDRDVALKLFRRDTAGLDADQLIAEARRHAQVHHPRVLAIHGAGVEDDVAGLWTDLLQGQTLGDAVANNGPLDRAALLDLARDLAAGLEAVHDQGIIHGDLKAANVWIDHRGRAILMDFGAAESSESDAPVRFGSPATMAPELFSGQAAAPASDMWALGAVLYHAACGRYPVSGQSYEEIQQSHRAGTMDFGPLGGAVGSPLSDLVRRLLDPAPDARPSAARVSVLVRDIESAPQRRFRRRALGAVFLSMLAGLVMSVWFLLEARQAQEEAEKQLARAEETADLMMAIIDRPRSTHSGAGVTIAEGIRAIMPRVDEALLDDPVGRGELLTHLGHTVLQIENLEQAGIWLEEALTLFRQAGYTAESYYRYARRIRAVVLAREARFDEAVALLEEDGPLVLSAAATEDDLLDAFLLGSLLSEAGDVDRGLPLASRANELAENVEFPGLLEGRLRGHEALASLHFKSGNATAAEAVLREGLAWAERNNVPERSEPLLVLRESLVRTLVETGRFDEAEPLINDMLLLLTDWLGPDSFDTFRMQNLKGILLTSTGRYEETVAFLGPVYQRIEGNPRLSGNSRIDVGNNLANALKEMGRADEALTIYLETRERAIQATGPDHPWALLISSNIAEVYLDLGRWAEALEVADATLTRDIERFGPEHLFTSHARMMKGAALSHLGKAEEGEQLIRESAGYLENALSRKSLHFVQSQLKLAESLVLQDKARQAREVILEILPTARETLGEQHALVLGLDSLLPPGQ